MNDGSTESNEVEDNVKEWAHEPFDANNIAKNDAENKVLICKLLEFIKNENNERPPNKASKDYQWWQ